MCYEKWVNSTSLYERGPVADSNKKSKSKSMKTLFKVGTVKIIKTVALICNKC